MKRLVVGLAMLLLAAPAMAADDGGTRSPFADGTGIRGLGMGSAFVAAADDASATFWNPGGLGRIPRLEAQTGFTQFEELGMTESWFAVALPSWRLGTTALSLRHAGVSGIEGRDDRNLPTGADFSDSETELAIGYGRPAGERWSTGGTLKFQRQSLAGLSGGGIGADLGVHFRADGLAGPRARWLDGVTLGLAVRNALQPSLRLDREAIPDPTTLQSGLAVRRLFANGASLLATLDVEKPRDLNARAHAGAELRWGSLLALRAGLHRGRLTAGTGLEWQGLAIQYSYEVRDLGSQQRIGLTRGFGPTVEQSRVAARDQAERAVQTRLDQAFGERQARQLDDMMARAEALRAEGRLDEALDVLTTIATLAPGHAPAVALEARCQREKAASLEGSGDLSGAILAYGRALELAPGDSVSAQARTRCRVESERRAARTAERRRRYDEAFGQFLAGDLNRARDGFAALLAEEPRDADARAMLARARRALEARAAERAGAAAVAPPAVAPVARPRALGGAVTEAPLDREQQRLAAELYRRGVQAMEARRPAEAIRYWEAVWSISPRYERVAEYLKREYLVRGLEDYAAGRLDEASAIWEKALRVDPEDSRARAYLARAREQKQRTRALSQDEP